MNFERFVATRYLKAERKGLFTLVTTVIAVSGVAIGVAALIATMSVMNGFQADIQKKIIGAQAHIVVHGNLDPAGLRRLAETLKRQEEVIATAPFALGQAIITFRDRSSGILLRGLDPSQEFEVNDLAKNLVEGDWSGLVLGDELAKNMGAWTGQEVTLISPQGMATPLGLVPRMRKFKVTGLVHTGYYEFDSATAYLGLPAAASFLGLPAGASGMAARLARLEDADRVTRRLQAELGYAYVVRSFNQMNQTLFAALRLEKYVMFLILALIILVAAFNIASTLILMGTEKLRDIGILKALGATSGQVHRIFLWEGLMIGGSGVGLGVALGLALCFVIQRYPPIELPPDIYYLSRVPVHVEARDVLAVTACGILLTLLAALYPALRAAKTSPVDAIHYG